jgi:4'-phosphopantetheinyl transferase
VTFTAGAHGKPQLQGGDLHFNVSHSGRYALIAISGVTPVGIDLERIELERPLADMAEQFYSDEEQDACRNDPEAFFHLWSCKEALVKAWGTGIADGLPALQGSADNPSHPAGQVWRIAAPHGYAAALAIA